MVVVLAIAGAVVGGGFVIGLIGLVIFFVHKNHKRRQEIKQQMKGRPKEEIQVALVKADQETVEELQIAVSKQLNEYPESVQRTGLALSTAAYHHGNEVMNQKRQGNLTANQAFEAFKVPIMGALGALPLAELTGAEEKMRLLVEDDDFQEVPLCVND